MNKLLKIKTFVIMTQENKELLMKDLCARLPYNVLVHIYDIDVCDYDNYLCEDYLDKFRNNSIQIKPYLRSTSSMSDQEKKELKNLCDAKEVTSNSICYHEGGTLVDYLLVSYSFCSEIIDWLNCHHFDYRGLIEKGLALEALEGMY